MDVTRQANGFFQFYEPWNEIDNKKVFFFNSMYLNIVFINITISTFEI